MNKILKEKIREALTSVMPITAIVFLLSVFVVPMPISTIMMFLFGAVLLIIGVGLFSLGADVALLPLGEGIGVTMTKSKKIWLIVLISFTIGFIVTMAEPDLVVLAEQVHSIPTRVLIMTVSVGVGIFLVIAVLRTIIGISLSHILIIAYTIIFIVSIFAPNTFLPVAFDSGGVTTGPITVPFIMAIGMGITVMRNDKHSQTDSFGLVGTCSIGPILAVLILGIVYNPQEATYVPVVLKDVVTVRDAVAEFFFAVPIYFQEVLFTILPLFAMFVIYQVISRRFQKTQLVRIIVGFFYTFAGLVLFFCGVNVGFIPVSNLLGAELAGKANNWILIPVGMVIGYFVVAAEPAIHVLNKQVEEVSNGAIPQKAMSLSLSIGVAISLGISMLRVLTGISIYYFLVPGYLISLSLTFFVPKIFTGIAFDSGGAASGPMTSTFILPFTMGACEAVGGNVLTDAFGVVAMVAMTPLIAIQIMGLIFSLKTKAYEKAEATEVVDTMLEVTDEILDFDEEDISHD